MKKITLISIIFLVLLTNCAILNPLGLSVDREKGSDAKDRITTAAITTDLLNSTLLTGGRFTGFSILSLIAGDLTSINDSDYYLKDDVDECIADIENFVFWLVLSPLTPIFSCGNIDKADGVLIGDPLPAL